MTDYRFWVGSVVGQEMAGDRFWVGSVVGEIGVESLMLHMKMCCG
jgi:hypothetical protein